MKKELSKNDIVFIFFMQFISIIVFIYVLNEMFLIREEVFKWFATDNIWGFLDAIITLFTLAVVIYGIIDRRNKERFGNELITIYFLVIDGNTFCKKYRLKSKLLRKVITRSEIQGVLSSYQKVISIRYSIDYMNSEEFYNDIYEVQTTNKKELVIKVTQKEFDGSMEEDTKKKDFSGFDISKMELVQS